MRCPLVLAVLAWNFGLNAHAAKHHSHQATGLTCSSTTINYITQTLPQQCLRTDWRRHGSDQTSTAGVTPTVNNAAGPNDDSHVSSAGFASSSSGAPHAEVHNDRESDGDENAHKSSTAVEAGATPTVAGEEDGDPLSDQGSFLSFEEWKARMLKESGQSPDHISGRGTHMRNQGGIENALDSLGEEGEIELDFAGFINPETTPSAGASVSEEQYMRSTEDDNKPKAGRKRSREAGTTSKERFNYASFDCAATVLKTNTGSKGATWILSENKDSYLINKCSETNKHFIVELCSDIWIDTVVLGNFEFFSSTFRHFRVSISDHYPVKSDKWKEIGTFEARNTRGVQAFLVEDGAMWARYFKIELLTHYGKEYYCPVSLLRVHGKTMMDDLRNDMKESHDVDDGEDEDEETVGEGEIMQEHKDGHVDSLPSESTHPEADPSETAPIDGGPTGTLAPRESDQPSISVGKGSTSWEETCPPEAPKLAGDADHENMMCSVNSLEALIVSQDTAEQITPAETQVTRSPEITDARGESTQGPTTTGTATSSFNSSADTTYDSNASITGVLSTTTSSVEDGNSTVASQSNKSNTDTKAYSTATDSPSSQADSNASTTSTILSTSVSSIEVSQTTVTYTTSINQTVDAMTGSSVSTKAKSTKTPTPIKAAPAVPATQDSFFRSVHKRLQMLESNSTLSLQYIEEQSRILRDAFSKAEKRQLLRTSNFLESLNSTVLGELRNFRIQYDQIWQSTVLELASQREQSQREVHALGERMGILANELVWQKRVVYMQFILIVLCLGLVIFGRNEDTDGSRSAPLELSLLRSIQNLGRNRDGASVSFAKRYPSSPESPPDTPSRPGSMAGLFRRNTQHRRYLSDGVTSGEETGLGTEVTTSPEQKHRGGMKGRDPPTRLYSLSTSDDMTLADDIKSKTPSIDLQPPTPIHGEEMNGLAHNAEEIDLASENEIGGLNAVPEANTTSLKRAASSPLLGQQDEELTDANEIE